MGGRRRRHSLGGTVWDACLVWLGWWLWDERCTDDCVWVFLESGMDVEEDETSWMGGVVARRGDDALPRWY